MDSDSESVLFCSALQVALTQTLSHGHESALYCSAPQAVWRQTQTQSLQCTSSHGCMELDSDSESEFQRLVREVPDMGKDLRFQSHALMAMQVASEAYLVGLLRLLIFVVSTLRGSRSFLRKCSWHAVSAAPASVRECLALVGCIKWV
jgi:hypothetical protein